MSSALLMGGRPGPLDEANLAMGPASPLTGSPADVLESDLLERIYWPLMDTQLITAATTGNVNYFVTLPANGFIGNAEDTQRMPNGQVQIVKYIAVTLPAGCPTADAALLANSLALTIRVNERTYIKNPLYIFGGLGALGGYAGAAVDNATLGLPGQSNAHFLPISMVLHDQATFEVTVSVIATLAALVASRNVGIILGGIRGRRPTAQ